MNKKKLDISKEESKRIQKRRRLKWILSPIVGGISVIVSLITGYYLGKNESGQTYPYDQGRLCTCCFSGFAVLGILGMGLLIPGFKKYRKESKCILGILAISIVITIMAFMWAYAQGQPVYSEAIKYGVYTRKK